MAQIKCLLPGNLKSARMTHFAAVVLKAGNTPEAHPFRKSHLSVLQWLMPLSSSFNRLKGPWKFGSFCTWQHKGLFISMYVQSLYTPCLCIQGFVLTKERAAKTEGATSQSCLGRACCATWVMLALCDFSFPKMLICLVYEDTLALRES